jgi:hypothetical protein
MDWRDTKRPVKPVIRVAQNWRLTVRKKAEPFNIEDHKPVIQEIAKSEAKQVKAQLKNELTQVLKNEISKIKVKDGEDANQWHILESAHDEVGKGKDLGFLDGDIYKKESGEWVLKQSIKQKRQNTLVTGGVSENFVNQAIQNALNDVSPGAASEVIVTTSSDYTITNETHLHMSVSSQKTVTVPSTNTVSTTIKNSSTSTADVILTGATFDGQSDWTIKPGNAFKITPLGAGAYDIN